MRKIKLKNSNRFLLVSNEDYDEIIGIGALRLNDRGYAEHRSSKRDKRTKSGYRRRKLLPHLVLARKYLGPCPDNFVVVMKNGNKLNCLPTNLQYLSKNAVLVGSRSYESKTGLRGAYEDKRGYRSQISINGKNIHLGIYGSAEEAHREYRRVRKKHPLS